MDEFHGFNTIRCFLDRLSSYRTMHPAAAFRFSRQPPHVVTTAAVLVAAASAVDDDDSDADEHVLTAFGRRAKFCQLMDSHYLYEHFLNSYTDIFLN